MSNTQDVKIIKEYYIYSVEGLGGSDGGVQLFEATRTAAEAQANEIVRLSNTATDDSMGKLVVTIRKHTVRIVNSPKRAWIDGFESGRNQTSIENVGHDTPEVVAAFTSAGGWLTKDDRSNTRRLINGADNANCF
jgi:hypothetical protein